MNAILAIPLTVRLVVLFTLGVVVGEFVNLGVYRLAWQRRSISPWSPPLPGATARRWLDRIPIFGWWRLRRESPLHGRGFWIRPMLVEAATGALLTALYLWEVEWAEVLVLMNVPAPRADFLTANVALASHVRFLGHAVLVSLMLVASLIDLDEKTIPDSITVSGTLAGLVLAAVYPWSLLKAGDWAIHAIHEVEFLSLVSPEPWPAVLRGWPLVAPLGIALGCWTLWCGGLLPRRWNTQHGVRTAVRVFFHRLRREQISYWISLMWLVGAVAIVIANRTVPEVNWAALLTVLVGMAAAGGLVWVVRVVGTAALEREAMGFGDVTLMSMIGAFVGWQPALVVFFLAPFFALVLGIAERILRGEQEIPFGPFLCLATLLLIVQWVPIWRSLHTLFWTGWLLPAVLAFGMVLLGVMLWVYRMIRG